MKFRMQDNGRCFLFEVNHCYLTISIKNKRSKNYQVIRSRELFCFTQGLYDYLKEFFSAYRINPKKLDDLHYKINGVI
jgi:hypothetical protein